MSEEHLTQDLVERAKAGDNAAFAQLWERYWPRLLEWVDGKVNGSLKSRVDAEDILQTVFRTFHRHLPSGRYVIDERGKLWVLLVGIAKNKIRQKTELEAAQKRNHQQDEPLTTALLAMLVDGKPSPEISLTLRDELDWVFQNLSSSDAEIARLGICEQHSLREIVRTTQRSLPTVRRVMGRVRHLLRTRLSD